MFGSGLLHDGPVVHPLSAVKTQPASLCWPTMEGMTEVLKKVQITVYCIFSNTATVENLASGLVVQVHQKFMQLAPLCPRLGLREFKDVEWACGHSSSSREDGHYMDNITVSKVGDASPRD